MNRYNEDEEHIFCKCSPKRRIEKTDGLSRLMCANCNRLIDDKKRSEKPLHPLIARWRKR